MANQTKAPKRVNIAWIGGGIILLTLLVTAVVSWILYEHTVNLLTDNLRQRLLSIGITQSANINSGDVEKLQKEEDWKKPEWVRVVDQLKKAKDTNSNIVFMYIFRKTKDDPTKMEFVADAESINPYANTDDNSDNDIDANGDGIVEPDGADQLQWPGQEYPEPPEEAFAAYEGPLTNKELYSDAYGEVLTGYAPIKNKDGNTVAILGTDIKAGDFLSVTTQTLYPFILFIVFLEIAIVILSGGLIRIWNKQIELVKQLDRQKDELISIVSHQLNAPVTAVRWYIDEFEEGIKQPTKEQKESIGTMRGVVADLSDLISMLLDVSRIQLGRMKVSKQQVSLADFFKEILEVIEPKAKEKNIHFIKNLPSELPVANIDKRMTRMTVENLLTNAVKYTPEKGEVELNVTITNGVMKCVVRDTGCGIPAAEQGKVFDKLFRASNVQNVTGNGFGLYIAKGAIEAQGGKISFASTEGKGTTFTVELPIS